MTQPTVGSNVEEVRHGNLSFVVWDLGGQESLRASWSMYYINTHVVSACVFVYRLASFHVYVLMSSSVNFAREAALLGITPGVDRLIEFAHGSFLSDPGWALGRWSLYFH